MSTDCLASRERSERLPELQNPSSSSWLRGCTSCVNLVSEGARRGLSACAEVLATFRWTALAPRKVFGSRSDDRDQMSTMGINGPSVNAK